METYVLVVDDSPVDQRLAGGIIERSGGYWAMYASNGAEALEILEKGQPTAVLTDLLMPEMDGLELTEEIRRKHPLVPVILMTAFGSEDIAIQALQRGAASYVPKKSLAQDLPETLEQVLATLRVDTRNLKLAECVSYLESHFQLDSDPTLVPALISRLKEDMNRLNLGDETTRIRMGVAIEEAVLNGIYHGNLEVSSDLKQNGDEKYYQLANERRTVSPFQERHLHVEAKLSRKQASYIIRDEGPGFDPSTLPDPSDPANLERVTGRGLLLIRTFMDQVTYNAAGNEITMVKFCRPGGEKMV